MDKERARYLKTENESEGQEGRKNTAFCLMYDKGREEIKEEVEIRIEREGTENGSEGKERNNTATLFEVWEGGNDGTRKRGKQERSRN